MPKTRSFAGWILFIGLFIWGSASPLFAQTAIFNIPSTDVVPRKLFYIEADLITNFKTFDNGGFQSYGYRTVYGVSRNLEAGVNFFYSRNGTDSPMEIQPNLKWKSYSNERYGINMSTGGILYVPLNRASGTHPFGMVYSNVSKSIPQANGLRVTGGIYSVVGAKSDFGTRFGAIVGIEQPIKGKLSFLGDWYSGKNQFGFAAAGLNYSISSRQFISGGYNFSNSDRSSNAFSFFYGFTF